MKARGLLAASTAALCVLSAIRPAAQTSGAALPYTVLSRDARRPLALAASGKIKTVAETCRLDQINEVFDRMREGRITGRVVVEM